jgi:hypothetical protein
MVIWIVLEITVVTPMANVIQIQQFVLVIKERVLVPVQMALPQLDGRATMVPTD